MIVDVLAEPLWRTRCKAVGASVPVGISKMDHLGKSSAPSERAFSPFCPECWIAWGGKVNLYPGCSPYPQAETFLACMRMERAGSLHPPRRMELAAGVSGVGGGKSWGGCRGQIGVARVGVNCTIGVMEGVELTSTESRDRCPRCLGLALSSTEGECTTISEMNKTERPPSRKEMKGEEFCQGCNISAPTARLEDAWRP